MFAAIMLTDCPGLIDLMLTGDEHGMSFAIDGVECVIEHVEGHGIFEAVTPDFGLSVIHPGWYAGDHGAPAYVAIIGDAHACIGWLPLRQADKLTLIRHLPLSPVDQMLCRLSA
jgi:hypothetical protein